MSLFGSTLGEIFEPIVFDTIRDTTLCEICESTFFFGPFLGEIFEPTVVNTIRDTTTTSP